MKPITLIKFGGSLNKNDKIRKKFFDDVVSLAKKELVVLVHGGGPEINIWLDKLGIKTRFIKGLRYTDKQTLEVVEMVLSAKVNKSIVNELNKRGTVSVGVCAKDGKIALCKRIRKLGFVGEPQKINVRLIKTLLQSGYLPVISSIGFDNTAQTLNINSDSLAMGIAGALKPNRLILLTNVDGVLDKNKKSIKEIKIKNIPSLIKNEIVTGGMIPKIKACANALKSGVRQVWIANGCYGLENLKGTVVKK